MPVRRVLPHTPPLWVESGALYFITACGCPRGQNQFAVPCMWTHVRSATEWYVLKRRWHVRFLLAMPDHVHLIASFPAGEMMVEVVAAWKHYIAHSAGTCWQRGFFDHRLRNHESLDEKTSYIRMNPVRAGLVAGSDIWPYVWAPPNPIGTPV